MAEDLFKRVKQTIKPIKYETYLNDKEIAYILENR